MYKKKIYHRLTGVACFLIGVLAIIFSLFLMPIGGSRAQTPTTATFIVTFDSKGGSSIPSQQVSSGNAINYPIPTKSNAIFDGWYSNYVIYSDDSNYPQGCNTDGLDDANQNCILGIPVDNPNFSGYLYVAPAATEVAKNAEGAYNYCRNDLSLLKHSWTLPFNEDLRLGMWNVFWNAMYTKKSKIYNFTATAPGQQKSDHYWGGYSDGSSNTNCIITNGNCGDASSSTVMSVRCVLISETPLIEDLLYLSGDAVYGDMTLYAKWHCDTGYVLDGDDCINYIATFESNGADSIGLNMLTGDTIIMPNIIRDGREILGRSTNSGATEAEYTVGENVTLSGDMTFYAITKKTYTVTFETNGADSIGSDTGSCAVYNTQTSCIADVAAESTGNNWQIYYVGEDITVCDSTGECLTIMDRNLGATTNDTSSTGSYGNYYDRGGNYPCATGYHAWTQDEFNFLVNLLLPYDPSRGFDYPTFFAYLKMPYAGHSYNGTVSGIGGEVCVRVNAGQPLKCFPNSIGPIKYWNYDRKEGYGYSVRCTKDEPSNLRIYKEGTDITFCDESDGSCITMMDRNLGATTTDITSTGSYGYYYQWGNNYGFSLDGPVATSGSKIDCSNYGPLNPFSSSSFFYGNDDYCQPRNNNMRGNVTNTTGARQGPCPDGYHVPSMNERGYFLTRYFTGTNISMDFQADFNIPNAGYINTFSIDDGSTNLSQGLTQFSIFFLRSSSVSSHSNNFGCFVNGNSFCGEFETERADAVPVRCFKNYPSNIPFTITRSRWEVLGWSTNSGATQAEYTVGDNIRLTGDTTLYAITSQTPSITFKANGNVLNGQTGNVVENCTMYNTQTGCNITTPTISNAITQTVVGYTTTSEGASTANIGSNVSLTISSPNIYYAQTKTPNVSYTATFSGNGANVSETSKICNTEIYNGATNGNCTVIAPNITRDGWTILGWSTKSGAIEAEYQAGDNISLTGNTIFYAVTKNRYTATFNKNGATSIGKNELSCDVYNTETSCNTAARSISDTRQIYNIGTDITICDQNDSNNCITMMDRNLGATEAGTGCVKGQCKDGRESRGADSYEQCMERFGQGWMGSDPEECIQDYKGYGSRNACDEAMQIQYNQCVMINSGAYGNLYQWGNNYGFSPFESVTTSESKIDCSIYNSLSNPLNRGIFIIRNTDYCSAQNDDLWGDTTNTLEARQGPCPSGYHVPTKGEWENVISMWAGTGVTSLYKDEYNILDIQTNFKIPLVGSRFYYYGNVSEWSNATYFWTSSPNSKNAWYFYISPQESAYITNTQNRAEGYSVRCFRNEPTLITSFVLTAPDIIRDGYTALGWSTDSESTEAEYQVGDTIILSGDTTFYAITEKMAITATFLPGQTVNTRLKSLATGATVTSINDVDTLIQQIVRTGAIPTGVTTGLLSTNDSETPIIAWYDSGILYYYTEADVIYLNQNSSYMFDEIKSCVYIDTSGWDTSKVTNMRTMFQGCRSLIEIDVSKWDTSRVTDMSYMFNACRSLTGLDVSNFDTSKVTNMQYMFSNCSSLESLDVNNFDTSKVTNMRSMFNSCGNLTGLDVSNWDTSNIIDMSFMFYNCSSLTKLDVSEWNTSKVTNMNQMFYGCSNLTELDVSEWDTSSVTNMQSMFEECSSLTGLDVSNWDTSSVTNMVEMLQGNSSLTSLDVSNWNTSSVTNMHHMFDGCSNLTRLDVSSWNTSKVTNMDGMFQNCYNLTGLDVSEWDTSRVTNMQSMFSNCSGLTELDVRGWDTSSVTNMSSMFSSCNSLTELDVRGWDTSKVTNMQSMFSSCSSLIELDTSGWNTSNVTNMQSMFRGCSKLDTIYASTGFITSGVTSSSSMFYNTPKLIGGHGTKWNSSYRDKTRAVLDSESQSGYLTYDIAVSYRTSSGVELARQVINVGDTTVAPSITGYNVMEYYTNTGLTTPFDFSQELRTYTEVYVDRVCADGYRLADGACEKILTATFKDGSTVNKILKSLATGATVTNTNDVDTLIQQIVRTGAIPTGVTTGLLSTNDSETPIIARFDSGTIYYYSDADILYLNQNSSYMFYHIQSGTYIDTSGWNTSKVTNMQQMFAGCSKLIGLDVSGWDTSRVTVMSSMFQSCNSITGLNVSNWNTSNVTNMSNIFYGCGKLIGLDVGGWDTSEVTNMKMVFYGCSSLTGLDISNWNTSKVTNMSVMFRDCSSLTGLDVSRWDTSKVTNMGQVFYNCSSLRSLDVSDWDTSRVTDMSFMFSSCSSLTGLDVSNWNTSNVTDMSSMFSNCSSLKNLDVEGWNTSKVTNMSSMFGWCSSLTGLDVSNWNTSKVTNMSSMFGWCSSLTDLNVSHFDTSNVTDISQMFAACGSLTGLDVSSWDTSNMIDISRAFRYCNKLMSLDVNNRNTSNVTNMLAIFDGCSSLTELDVSNWNTNKVVNMKRMFNSCSNLNTIYASTGFITSRVTDSVNMFSSTPKLIGGHGTKYNRSIVDKTRAVLDSESQLGYLTYDIAVSYRTRSGVELARQVIDVGDTTVAPMIIRTGYAVSGWYTDTGLTTLFDFSQALRKYTELYVMWKCDTGYMLSGDGVTCIPLTYEVRHFIKNAGELSYTLSGTEIFTGIAGEQVYFDDLSQTYPSCIVYSRGSLTGDENGPGEIETKTDISGDGSTVINLFYDRNTYTVDLSRDFGIGMVEGAGTYECGQEVQIRAYPIDGYHFDMWEGEVD